MVNDLALDVHEGAPNIFFHNEGQGDGEPWSFRSTPEAALNLPMLAMGLALGVLSGRFLMCFLMVFILSKKSSNCFKFSIIPVI